MPVEAITILNKLLYDGIATVTTSPRQISDFFGNIFDSIPAEIKTLEITNMSSSVNVFFSVDGSRNHTNAGGVIKAGHTKEIPLRDIRYSPFFVCSGTAELRLAFWG